MRRLLKALLNRWKRVPRILQIIIILSCGLGVGYIINHHNDTPSEEKTIREFYNSKLTESKEVSYNEFQMMAYNGEIDTLWYNTGKEKMVFAIYTEESKGIPNELRNVYDYPAEQYMITQYPDGESFRQQMLMYNINLVLVRNPMDNTVVMSFIGTLISTFVLIGAWVYIMKSQGGSNMKAEDLLQKGDVDLEDIIGLDEIMGELKLIINLMKKPEYGAAMGVKLPRGILLSGPSGTGKTMIAKAISKAVDIPFISVNGSDFQELYVGNGARHVRQVFKVARQNSPCIVFIDEFDAIGERRDSRTSNSEDTKTINAILKEMDGFTSYTGIFVMAATNHPERIDAAIKRPGRFDREIIIAPPRDWSVRAELFKHYLNNKPLAEDVSFESIAKATPGFTGADIATICNEAGIVALSNNLEYINTSCIEEAIDKKVFKGSRSTKVVSEEDRRVVAYHEAGHAIVSLLNNRPISRISIISTTSGVGGAVFNEDTDSQFKTDIDFIKDIMICYAGRASEFVMLNSVTTGASNDITQATNLIHDYICKYGFMDEAPKLSDEVMTGFGINMSDVYMEHISRIAKDCYSKTCSMIAEHRELVEKLANHLLDVTLMSGDEVTEFLNL